jgi:outer membrane protein assembly factor BamD (BamD/ComL family)
MPRGSQPNTSTKSIEAPDLLREETRELRSAQQALRTGNAGLALKLLAEQDRTFNNGLLQEERAAARVLALCQTGQTDIAKVEAARFEKRWPKSALVARVRSSCF